MDDIKLKIEAILFSTGKYMTLEDISKAINVASHGAVRQALQELIKEYLERNTSLQIFENEGKYMLNIKKSYNYLTTNLLNESELDRVVQETLAVIAYKQPIMQSDLIKIRGNSAYEHVKILKEQNFITSEKSGRTRILKLTSKFFDYFDLVEIEKLKKIFKNSEQKIGFSLSQNGLKEKTLTEMFDKTKLKNKSSEKDHNISENDSEDSKQNIIADSSNENNKNQSKNSNKKESPLKSLHPTDSISF